MIHREDGHRLVGGKDKIFQNFRNGFLPRKSSLQLGVKVLKVDAVCGPVVEEVDPGLVEVEDAGLSLEVIEKLNWRWLSP